MKRPRAAAATVALVGAGLLLASSSEGATAVEAGGDGGGGDLRSPRGADDDRDRDPLRSPRGAAEGTDESRPERTESHPTSRTPRPAATSARVVLDRFFARPASGADRTDDARDRRGKPRRSDASYPLRFARPRDGEESNVLFSWGGEGGRKRGSEGRIERRELAGGEAEGRAEEGAEEERGEGHSDAHDDDESHGTGTHVTYEQIYAIFLFLIVATGAGVVASKLGMPALVGEIVAGFLLGPPLADFVPFPEALVLVGEIGLIMLLLEAGVELDVAQLRETGTRALAIGLTGTLLPLGAGMALAYASGNASVKSAMAVGASFSPTSLGVAASALKAGKMVDTPVGQLIVASCVVDDVLALILLSMFKVLVKPDPSIVEYFLPIISSVGFLIVLGGSAVTWLPRLIEDKILKRCSESYRELVMFSIMAVMLLLYLPLLNYTQASYLTGAFLAGVVFSQIEHAHHAFMDKTHQLMTWLLRVFFAASIGFQVPLKQFGDPYVIAWGFILYLCVAAKLPLAFYVPQFEDVGKGASYNPFLRDRIITALAMTCRGEFSFIIAAFALSNGLFDAQIYAAIVWAVLLSCVTSPFMLLNLIKYFNKKQMEYLASANPATAEDDGGDGTIPLFLHIKVKAPAFGGMQEQFRKIVNDLGLEVVERRTNRDGRGLNATVQTDLYVRDTTMKVALQKIAAQKKIKRALASALEDPTNGRQTIVKQSVKKGLSNGSMRLSSNNLSNLSLVSLVQEEQDALQAAAKEEDAIIERGELVEKKIDEALGCESEVMVDVWNPWPWTEVLDKILDYYSAGDYGEDNVEVFVAVFDKIDADGGGEIDQDEMYQSLVDAGLDISEEGVVTLVNMIDADGNGDIDRDEWRETVEFYLEMKREEEEAKLQTLEDPYEAMKRARRRTLEEQVKANSRAAKGNVTTPVTLAAGDGTSGEPDEFVENVAADNVVTGRTLTAGGGMMSDDPDDFVGMDIDA